MNVPYALLLDVILAVLLVVMIWYSVALNRRLIKFRGNREEMERLARNFNEAIGRAGDSIGQLRIASDALQDQLGKAESLRDDLVFLIDRGTVAADRLEDTVRGARREIDESGQGDLLDTVAQLERTEVGAGKTDKARPAPKVAPGDDTDAADDGEQPRSEAERALLKAIRSAT